MAGPFLGRYAWSRRSEVDADAVRASAGRLVGTHNFASFAGGGEGVPWSHRATRPKGTARTIFRCDCREIQVRIGPGSDESARVLEVRVVADGFLPQMVRNIVGALLDVGQGRRDPDWISELLTARDRRFGAATAPAHGLTLTRVGFSGELLDDN